MERNLWLKWGFNNNPFNHRALSMNLEGLPIHKAFVGRSLDSEESFQLLNVLRDINGGCAIVEGNIGVGKTTLVNYHRYLWEYKSDDKILSPLTEIPIYGKWEVKDFLREILGHLSNKMLHFLEEKKIKKSALLEKLRFLHEIFYRETVDVEASIFGVNFGYRKNNQAQINIPELTESNLIAYLMDMVKEVKKMGYGGVFLHFDNLELLSRQDLDKCQQFFEEIRDIMQLPNLYFIFVAQKGFYSQVVAPSERVRSIMSWPIQVPPLSFEEVLEVIHTRYKLLALKPGMGIPPVRDEFIKTLYDLYQGKIRFIMDSISQITNRFPEQNPRTLTDSEAKKTLSEIAKIKTALLSPKDKEILIKSLEFEEFTPSAIAEIFSMHSQNVSRTFKNLMDDNLIYLVRKQGRESFYKAREDLKALVEKPAREKENIKPMGKREPIPPLKKEKRLKKAEKYFQKHSPITRLEYEEKMGVPTQTACRDLAFFVKKGVLKKEGKGRATVYQYLG